MKGQTPLGAKSLTDLKKTQFIPLTATIPGADHPVSNTVHNAPNRDYRHLQNLISGLFSFHHDNLI